MARHLGWILLSAVFLCGCADWPKADPQVQDPAERLFEAGLLYRHALALLSGPEQHQDYAAANEYFEQAANLGHVKAQYFLGMSYYTGRGVRQSYPNARYWLELAAGQGDANAQFHVGDLYLNGWGVVVDQDWAAMWFGRAAQQGNAAAQFSLGVCYASGLGLPKQPLKARGWLQLAAQQGYPGARELDQKLAQGVRGRLASPVFTADGWESPPVVTYVQLTLTKLGFDPGPADGVWGSRTSSALATFLKLPADDAEIVLTAEVLSELRRARKTLPSPFMDRVRRWFF